MIHQLIFQDIEEIHMVRILLYLFWWVAVVVKKGDTFYDNI